ncbi:glycosyltransferase [Ruegeria arenilitoris]|uniref:glycosyltransferase n=1 Tax=Ruegeria arenilitoris TaxID=1173585 RepID=UPI00148040E0|nr:glycosyltransferase [Ruegeria arenilitoris]
MNILHVSPTFYPATYWGGPIYSTKAICDSTHGAGASVTVLSTDAAGPGRSDRLASDAGNSMPYPVCYSRRTAGVSISPMLLARLPRAIAKADLVHLTGTFSFPTLPTLLLAKLIGRPVVWSPRGAIQATLDWKDSPKQGTKRRFLALASRLLPRGSRLHATAAVEAEANGHFFPDVPSVVIANSVQVPEDLPPHRDSENFRLIFVSRLHPKKGLDLLIEAMGRLPENVTLDIYGSGDPAYTEEVNSMAASLPGRVKVHGHLADDQKAEAFANSDLFVLPSHSENFGIVVAEALAHGVPALTTTNTPWAFLDETGCGRCIPLSVENLVKTIAELSVADLLAMGVQGRALAAERFSETAMGERFLELYGEVLSLAPEGAYANG